ncbi:hypothetical protein [Okeania sp. SIO3B5]|nr:hypothetical protein [Okeania sp. SIO3B5]
MMILVCKYSDRFYLSNIIDVLMVLVSEYLFYIFSGEMLFLR